MAYDKFSENNRQQAILFGTVKTVHHPPPREVDNGMDPQAERLLLALLGSCVALIALVTLLFICCRRYKVAGMRKTRWRHHGQMIAIQHHQHLYYSHLSPLYYPGLYYPSQFYQTAAPGGVNLVDPRLLAPGIPCVVNSAAVTSSSTGATATAAATSLPSQHSSSTHASGSRADRLWQQILASRQQRKKGQRFPLISKVV